MKEKEKPQSKKKERSDLTKKWEDKSVFELKMLLQKLKLDVKAGNEKDSSLVKKLKKYIARALTNQNSHKLEK